jgi:hypothetical protein
MAELRQSESPVHIIDEAHRASHDAIASPTDEIGETGRSAASSRRVNVNFAPSAYQALERLAARKGKTMSEVLRDAIQLESWLAAAEDEGWHILLERNGRVRELARI